MDPPELVFVGVRNKYFSIKPVIKPAAYFKCEVRTCQQCLHSSHEQTNTICERNKMLSKKRKTRPVNKRSTSVSPWLLGDKPFGIRQMNTVYQETQNKKMKVL